MRIQHESRSVALTQVLATTEEIQMGHFEFASIIIPTGVVITVLTFYASNASGGTYVPLNDSAGVAIYRDVVQGNSYQLPAAVLHSRFVKIVATSADGSVFLIQKG